MKSVPRINNGFGIYLNGGDGGGGSPDYQPIPDDVKDTYKRVTFIRSDLGELPMIQVLLPLDFDDTIEMTLVYDRPFNPAGQQYLWLDTTGFFYTKFFSGRVMSTAWGYDPATDYNAIFFNSGTLNLNANKSAFDINGHVNPPSVGASRPFTVRYLARLLNSGNDQQISFYNFKAFDNNGNLKYSLFPVTRIADNVNGVYCEQQGVFYPATNYSVAGPVIE